MDFHKPTQTVLVTSKLDDKENITSCDSHMHTSKKPLMYSVALSKDSLSAELIEKSKVFAVNFMPFRYSDNVDRCSYFSGRHKDKFEESDLRKAKCDRIDCSYIKESSHVIECEVTSIVESGDHKVFFGEIINNKSLNDEKRLLKKSENSFTTTIH